MCSLSNSNKHSLECAATKCDVADFNTREDDSQSGMHYKFTAICFVYIYIYIDTTTKTVIYEEQKHLSLLKN